LPDQVVYYPGGFDEIKKATKNNFWARSTISWNLTNCPDFAYAYDSLNNATSVKVDDKNLYSRMIAWFAVTFVCVLNTLISITASLIGRKKGTIHANIQLVNTIIQAPGIALLIFFVVQAR
jgi:hypothetical protein